MKKVTHNNQTCAFTDYNHLYQVGDQILKSVTTFKGEFFPKFDTKKVATMYARKHKIPVTMVMNDWRKKGDIGRRKGTLLHQYAEQLMEDQKTVFIPKEFEGFKKSADQAVTKLKKEHTFIANEKIVFSTELGLAGQIDLLMQTKNIVLIIDWKTNKQIDMINNWYEIAYSPIDHLDNCNFNEFSIQLNLYEYLLRKEKYFPDGTIYFKRVIHLTEDKPVWYKIPNMQLEIEDLLQGDSNG